MTNDKLEIAGKGFKWLRGTLEIYAKAKINGDTKTQEHIENEISLIESIAKMALSK